MYVYMHLYPHAYPHPYAHTYAYVYAHLSYVHVYSLAYYMPMPCQCTCRYTGEAGDQTAVKHRRVVDGVRRRQHGFLTAAWCLFITNNAHFNRHCLFINDATYLQPRVIIYYRRYLFYKRGCLFITDGTYLLPTVPVYYRRCLCRVYSA